MSNLFIGVLSGTSMDGIDVGLVEFGSARPVLLLARMHPMPSDLRDRLMGVAMESGRDLVEELAVLDVLTGELFAEAVIALLDESGHQRDEIRAIGSHGQTVRHRPPGTNLAAKTGELADAVPFTLQIGDPNVIAERTGITTVADFRRRDMAAGGQGAPLVPGFHQAMFGQTGSCRVVVNIGGIANITILPGEENLPIVGFDTGPGNVLLDAWAARYLGTPMDTDGAFAMEGNCHPGLLAACRRDRYFSLPPPKTSGREYFHWQWLSARLAEVHQEIAPEDVQRTLCDLTVTTLGEGISEWTPDAHERKEIDVFVCGGGAKNPLLLAGIRACLPDAMVDTTANHGVDPDWVEAMAFAWLARQRLENLPGNVPSVTGAHQQVVLGGVYAGAVSR